MQLNKYQVLGITILSDLQCPEAATRGVRKGVLKISLNSQKNNCARFFFLIKLQVSGEICEFSEISKNTFFTEYL